MTKQKPSLPERMKLFGREVWKHTTNSHCPQYSFLDNLKEGIGMYKYYVQNQMTERSLNSGLPEVRWTYDGNKGLFIEDDNTKLALVIPRKGWSKYIRGWISGSEQKIIAALPYGMHRSIVNAIEEMMQKELVCVSGGHINISKKLFSKPVLTLYGSSQDYGRANHQEVAEILRENGLEVKVEEEK